MQTLKEYINKINKAIAEIQYPEEPSGLYEPIRYTMDNGGKRIRPLLTLLCNDALGGEKENALPQAIGIELFHNFTLLHDDVMDNADMRRGQPTVHCKWDRNTAILSGDAMLTMATQFICDCSNEKLFNTISLFNKTAMEVYEGQQYDMNFETEKHISVNEYINMIKLKTSVLLGCACKLGAIAAGAQAKDCNAVYDFGINLGIAFQLQDDFLDVYGNSPEFGKIIGGDIINNKKTFLLTTAIEKADSKTKKELNRWLNAGEASSNQEKIENITMIYNSLGIPDICESKIKEYSDISLNSISAINMSNHYRELFISFVEVLMHRQK
jgi:hypothetical protein